MDNHLLETAKEKLTEIADILYKNQMDAGMSEMNQVIPQLVMIADSISDEAMQERLLNDALTPALEAMENRDATLLADIITYELMEILDALM